VSAGVGDVRVTAGYAWVEVGGLDGAIEKKQDEVTLDVTSIQFLSQAKPVSFSYTGNLVPQPRSDWFIALWIQEIARIPQDSGWLFRSGAFTTEPPSAPIEVILAPEQLFGDTELAGAISTPMTSGSTTVTSVTATVSGIDIAFSASGTDTNLPSGDTFTFMATLKLIPNAQVMDEQSPFEIKLTNESLSFTAGTGHGFETAILNALRGPIYGRIAPQLHNTIEGTLNAGVLSSTATRLNRGVPATMPAGVILSIRSLRPTARTTTAGATEPVIGVLGALGAFGGVVNKFPALQAGGGDGRCFIVAAATAPSSPEVRVLQAWRDERLRRSRMGERLIVAYERVSPCLAAWVARKPSVESVRSPLRECRRARHADCVRRWGHNFGHKGEGERANGQGF
jgi:hypothetical protein